MPIKKYLIALCAAASLSMAAEQEQPTPYDLIRPVWPLAWDTTVFDRFDTTVTKKHNMLPKKKTPPTYSPNTFIPDTTLQAYLDAMNVHISPIRVNQAGYLEKDSEKQFFYVGSATTFEVVDVDGNSLSPAITGTFQASTKTASANWRIVAGTNAATNDKLRYEVSFSSPTGIVQIGHIPAGVPVKTRLRIKVGDEISSTFIVSDEVYSMVRSAALKFYGINRSGDSESWFHGPSHTLDGAGGVVVGEDEARGEYHPEYAGTLAGGYYDCGDHLKESQTQMYAFMVAAVMAATNPDADDDNYAYNHGETVNTDGIPDMLREAKHGADYVLKAYVRAKGVIDDMALSVGSFGADHGWWGRPENQDLLPIDSSAAGTGRGGPAARAVRLGEIGSSVAGETAAGLALLAKDYAIYDKDFADSCLMIAKELYTFGKNIATGTTYTNNTAPIFNTPAYNGSTVYHDDMALAAVALLYATQDTSYLYDIAENPALRGGQSKQDFAYSNPQGYFRGGWFTFKQAGFFKDGSNTDWASTFTYALYAFYKLILKDEATAASYGITEARRLEYVEDVAYTMSTNVSAVSYSSGETESITLPQGGGWSSDGTVKYESIWYTMKTQQEWIYNRYQLGNTIDILTYSDVTKDLEGVNLPQAGVKDWKSAEMYQLAINQMNYLLGMNPWDISFIYGIGDKNDAHPHHRAANPEGKNVPGAGYSYHVPVGALLGGVRADIDWDPAGAGGESGTSWEGYKISEVCIDAAAALAATTSLVAQNHDKTQAPGVSVEIQHVSMDSAIVVVKLTTRGTTALKYGTGDTQADMTLTGAPDDSSSGVAHTVVLRNLQAGTTYYFYAIGMNAYDPMNATIKYMVDSTQTPFSFTTLNTVEAADIQNITVCNLTGDSAEIMWYTPNGEYESKIYWDTIPHTLAEDFAFNSGSGNADVSGIPTSFHYVKIGGLKEQTTYYYMVESNGVQVNVNENGELLKFTTPVGWYDFSVRTYQYVFGGMDFLDANVYNNEGRAFDSLTLRLYFTALPEEVEKCATLIDSDICQAYDEAGYNKPCENDRELRDLLRAALPVRLDDTYDASTGKYSYYFPAPLGSTIIKSQSRVRIDFGFSYGISNDGYKTCETLRQAAKKRFSKETGDWSWRPHTFLEDGADYDGMPIEDKDYGDLDNEVPENKFITVYRKGEFIWGYSPSYQEMTTKRAHYEMDVEFDAPFNVSNNSYVEIDQTSSTVYVTGHAHVTEGGYITKVWANGKQIPTISERIGDELLLYSDGVVIAHYNVTSGNGPIDSTGLWTLNIPVKMGIGSNKVDITLFAGPDPECEACTENGGCAFINRTYYVQFTKGNATAAALTIKDANGNSVLSPRGTDTVPLEAEFYVHLTDKDKAKTTTPLSVLVINGKKQDTLKVVMEEVAEGVFRSKNLISAVQLTKDKRSANQISFFAGDTIQVIYTDPDDEEDVAKQSFFAESNYPAPQKVLAVDTDCDNVADQIDISFSNALDELYAFDSIKVFFDGMEDSVTVAVPQPVQGLNEVSIPLTGISVPETAAPSGTAVVYLTTKGETTGEMVKISDGIQPSLMSITILENENHQYEEDTLMFSFTEPVILASESVWPIEISGVDQSSIQVVGKATTSNNGASWQYVIRGNTNGAVVPVGGQASIKSGFAVTDNSFNALSAVCVPTVTIAETPRPVPVSLAEMYDHEGDGYPDELVLTFEKKLRDKDMLDSFVVDWGFKSTEKSFLPSDWTHTTKTSTRTENLYDTDTTSATFGTLLGTQEVTDTISVITITISTSNGFPQGSTTGAYEGYGHVTPRKGPVGGFFDKYYSVVDRCPPILMEAKADTSGNYTILTVTASEPLSLDSSEILEYIERKRGSKMGVYLRSALSVKQSTEKQIYTYPGDAEDGIQAGDYVRLPILDLSRYTDLAGNAPTAQNPWRAVTGATGKTKFTVTLQQGVTASTGNAAGYGQYTPESGESFRISVVKDGEESLTYLTNNMVATGRGAVDSLSYTHAGPVFKIDISLPNALATDSLDNTKSKYSIDVKFSVDIFDNLGQFVNSQTVNIDASTIRNIISDDGVIHLNMEWLAHDGEAPVSQDGKKIGTGAYIAKFEFKASETNLKTMSSSKTTDDTTKTFGFKHVKRK